MTKDTDVTHKVIKKRENVVSIRKSTIEIEPIDYTYLKDSNPPPQEYILYPWLPVQGIALIYAATGVGKTLFTLNCAYAIAGGGNFLKYAAPKQKRVLYVDGEMSYTQLHSRFMNIVAEQGELTSPDNFLLLTPEKVYPHQLPKISSIEGQEFYTKLIQDKKVDVIVLDNLSTLAAIEENKSEEWYIIQSWLISLRAQGVSTLIVHHSGKDKRGYRGTSRMLDIVDTAISLQHVNDDQLESEQLGAKKFKIEYQKNRNFGGKEAFSFEVCLINNKWEFQSIENTNLNRVAECISIKMSQKEIAAEMGVSRPYISKLVAKARRLGMIRD